MNIFYFDNTFNGLLSAVFDAYKMTCFPDEIIPYDDVPPLFTEVEHRVETTNGKYERVSAALKRKLSSFARKQLTYVWLSETPESVMLLFRYIRKTIDSHNNIENNYADPDVLALKQLAKKVSHERHYMMMLVRFNKTVDGTYFSPIAPRYNVLPLVRQHYQERFADQKWAIYDEARGFGYYFDGQQTVEISLADAGDFLIHGRLNKKYMAEDEAQMMALWRNYFKALSIKERINPKQQLRSMPKRFWKYLPETWQDES